MESTSSVEKLIPDSSHNHWETSFIMPNSKSTQPLLQDSNKDEETNHTAGKLYLKGNATNVESGVALDPRLLMVPKPTTKRYPFGEENGVVQNGGYTIKYFGKKDEEIHC
ncbi:hypothetical protein YQE_03798, partial [Dendroctonus ponderosae]